MRHPNVPESLDGWSILHRMFALRPAPLGCAWPAERRAAIEAEAVALFAELAAEPDGDCGLVQLLGHKGDLMLTHYARSFDALGVVQARVDKLALRDYLDPLGSYVSVLELGLYGDTAQDPRRACASAGLTPHSDGMERGLRCRAARAGAGSAQRRRGLRRAFRGAATPASTR